MATAVGLAFLGLGLRAIMVTSAAVFFFVMIAMFIGALVAFIAI